MPNLVSNVDADFGGVKPDCRSTSSQVTYYRGCPVQWRSKPQGVRARSTTEAEYCALFEGRSEIERLIAVQLLENPELENHKVTVPNHIIFCDNLSALQIMKAEVPSKRNIYFVIRFLCIRDWFDSMAYIETKYNSSDCLNKLRLPWSKFELPLYPLGRGRV